ncbi:MAG: hypothetical protein HYU69_00295 [Bacteroidetes bacterium]|nr:hypothetical protein [Bacteroidota bacterium]
MKKIFFTSSIICLAISAIAQKEFYFGPSYTAGMSTILKSNNNMDMNGGMMNGNGMNSDLSFMPAFGTGIRLEYFPAWKWGLFFQCGYQQRGARFTNYMDNFNPRYKFQQCDFNLGGQLRTKGLIKNHQLLLQLGITQHYLSSTSRIYDTGSDNITDDTRAYDMGIYLGLGGNIPVRQKDLFQIMVFANQGFTEVFMGNMASNNMTGRNLLLGVQLSYLIGKTCDKKEN